MAALTHYQHRTMQRQAQTVSRPFPKSPFFQGHVKSLFSHSASARAASRAWRMKSEPVLNPRLPAASSTLAFRSARRRMVRFFNECS